MKKTISILLVFVFLMLSLVSCGNSAKNENNKKSIVVTIFPEYDWIMNILGDKKDEYDVKILLDNGVDLHNYQPTVDDIVSISKCDLFVYVGGESDEWVDDVLDNATNKDMVQISLFDILENELREEELKEGMQAEEEEEEEGEEEEEIEYDEHVWLSIKNAISVVKSLTKTLCDIDKENSDAFQSNSNKYISKLNELDNSFQNMVSSAKYDTLLFGDRFPFAYLVADYGIDYFAAFIGCSAESEASFETIKFLSEKFDELNLSSIIVLEGSNNKIANTIINTSKAKTANILVLDSMQTIDTATINSGATYINIMEKNLAALSTALN